MNASRCFMPPFAKAWLKFIIITQYSAADQAWQLLQQYLEKYEDRSGQYHRCTANKLLVHGFMLPTWLVNSYKVSETVQNCISPFPNNPWFLRVCFTSLLKTLGKGEIAHNEQFFLFPQCFMTFWRTFCHFHQI